MLLYLCFFTEQVFSFHYFYTPLVRASINNSTVLCTGSGSILDQGQILPRVTEMQISGNENSKLANLLYVDSNTNNFQQLQRRLIHYSINPSVQNPITSFLSFGFLRVQLHWAGHHLGSALASRMAGDCPGETGLVRQRSSCIKILLCSEAFAPQTRLHQDSFLF